MNPNLQRMVLRRFGWLKKPKCLKNTMMPKPFDSRSLGKVLHEVIEGEDWRLLIEKGKRLFVEKIWTSKN